MFLSAVESRKSESKERKNRERECDFRFLFSFFPFFSFSVFKFFSTLYSLLSTLYSLLLAPRSSTKNSSPSLSPRMTAATSPILTPLLWSVTTPREKLYVRTFSERSPDLTCPRLSLETFCVEPLSSCLRSLLESSSRALALLRCWERPLRTATVRPEGRWTARTVFCVFWRFFF